MDRVHNQDVVNLDLAAVRVGAGGDGGRRRQQRQGQEHELRRSQPDGLLNRGSQMNPWFP